MAGARRAPSIHDPLTFSSLHAAVRIHGDHAEIRDAALPNLTDCCVLAKSASGWQLTSPVN